MSGVIKIVELDDILIKKAARLVTEVFPSRNLPERLSFWVYKRRNNPFVRLISFYWCLLNYWAAVNDNGDVCGICGLYTYKKDEREAVWLGWFCVDPNHRGRGIGKKLIEFSIVEARKHNKKYFRLYTSTDPNEAAAQNLYEKYGFKITRREQNRSGARIFRELKL